MGGNSSKRLAAKCSFLSKEEQIIVSNSFKLASKNSDTIKEDDLMKLWGSQIDQRLCQIFCNFLFGVGETKQQTVEFQRYAELFVFCTRGTLDEKISILYASLDSSHSEEGHFPLTLLKEFVDSVISSYMKIQKTSPTDEYKSWQSRGCNQSTSSCALLSSSIINDLVRTLENQRKTSDTQSRSTEIHEKSSNIQSQDVQDKNPNTDQNLSDKGKASVSETNTNLEKLANASALSAWLHNSSVLCVCVRVIAGAIYGSAARGDDPLVPRCCNLDLVPSYPSLLTPAHLLFINSQLPQELTTQWRFLFSSHIHGESFSTLLGRIMNQGPCVMILEDNGGHIFGSFASESWKLAPRWTGGPQCLLFTLQPQMRAYNATPSVTQPHNYMYLNMHQHTLPNGMAMGGQFGYHGLWLDGSEYGKGECSETCATYKGYSRMSKDKQFTYSHLEVWAVGPPPKNPDSEDEGTSILDGNLESKAILEMSGRQMHSEGLREAPPDL